MMTTTIVALLASVEQKYQAVTTSASYASRSTGSVVGIAVSGAVYQTVLTKGLWQRFGSLPEADQLIKGVKNNMGAMHGLKPQLERGIMEVHMYVLKHVFLVLLGFAALGAASNAFVGEHRLYKTMARSESAEERPPIVHLL